MKNKFETINRDENSIFMERETGVVHSAFSREYELFESIKAGNPALVRAKAQAYLDEGITMGFLSRDNLKQYRYWAISTIAVAIHYAILGGMDETDAFNLSDEYIRYSPADTYRPCTCSGDPQSGKGSQKRQLLRQLQRMFTKRKMFGK